MNYDKLTNICVEEIKSNIFNGVDTVLSDFNRGEIGVLGYLMFKCAKVSSGELSDALKVSTARMSSILNSLESKRFVKRTNDEKDKRKTLVLITNKGKETFINAENELKEHIKYLIRSIGIDDFNEYLRITKKIKNIISNRK